MASSVTQGQLLGNAMAATAYGPSRELVTADTPAPVAQPSTDLVLMFERLAKDKDVDVDKLGKLIDLQKSILAHNAKSAFDAAFSRLQAALPEIDEKGQITDKSGRVRSNYARLEDIHAVIKPLLKEHGFAIRHRTEWPEGKEGIIRIVGILSHVEGHSEESAFEAPMDRSEYRTDIQSMGSTVSYGRRYTTIDLLNITTRKQDDDGSTSGRPEPPEGYIDWLKKLTETAEQGTKKFEAFWASKESTPDFKTYTVNHNKNAWSALKKRAAEVRA